MSWCISVTIVDIEPSTGSSEIVACARLRDAILMECGYFGVIQGKGKVKTGV